MSKICYLTYQSFPSIKANTIQTISNLKYFVRNGYEVELIFPLREKNSSDKLADLQEFYSFNEYIKVRGVKHNYPFGKVFLFEKLFFLFSHLLWSKKIVNNLIKSNYIDYTFFTRSEWIAYFLSQQKLNVLYECHQSSKIKKLLVPLIIKNKKSKIIFLNENLNKSFNLKKKFYSRISTLHNGVDSELFDENIEKNINDIIFVGNLLRFNKKRDIEFLINSFKDTRLSKKYAVIQVGLPDEDLLDGSRDFRGKLSMPELAALLGNSLFFIGQEGFIMHLARSQETRSVIIYGGRIKAWQSGYPCNENVETNPPCSPCWQNNKCDHSNLCMAEITIDHVLQAVERLEMRLQSPLETDELLIPKNS